MTWDFDAWRARSPFYDETHDQLVRSVRTFVEREIAPFPPMREPGEGGVVLFILEELDLRHQRPIVPLTRQGLAVEERDEGVGRP